MSSNKTQKRCSSGQTANEKDSSVVTQKTSSTLSRSKTYSFNGGNSLKFKSERLQPINKDKTTPLNDVTILDEINVPHPAMINELVLHARGLNTIPNLSQFSKLQMLDLSCNSLIRIENLKSLTNLREIKLYGNQIERIENLESLTQLQSLQLQYNEIETIGSGLNCLSRLQNLRLDSNLISSIRAEEMTKLVQLKSLDVSDCSLTNLDFINVLSSINELKVCRCQLKSLPSLTRNLRFLIDLNLSNNDLTQITLLKSFSSLRVLCLSNNQIQDIQILSFLVHLNELILSNNQIKTIPNSFEKLLDLRCLNVAHNQISTWKDINVVSRLSSLFILAIDGNPLLEQIENYLEKFVELCPSLEILDDISVKTNQSKILPNESTEEMKNLHREMNEIDEMLKKSIASVESQFNAIRVNIEHLHQLRNENDQSENLSTKPANQKSKHRLFQALTFSEENYEN